MSLARLARGGLGLLLAALAAPTLGGCAPATFNVRAARAFANEEAVPEEGFIGAPCRGVARRAERQRLPLRGEA